MGSVVADTHSIVWYLHDDSKLSAKAVSAMDSALGGSDPIFVASISLVELTYLVEKRRLPDSALNMLRVALTGSSFGFRLAPLDLLVADTLPQVRRDEVPDPPDRVIAATALALKLPLVTCDGRIRASGIQTIW